MNRYVSYDLTKADSSDYKELTNLIKTYKGWKKINDSMYLVPSNESLKIFKDKLAAVTRVIDKVYVVSASINDAKIAEAFHTKVK